MEFTSGFYRDNNDLELMRGLLLAARPDAADWRYLHCGAGLVWMFFMLSARVDPRQHIRLWFVNGELIGTAWPCREMPRGIQFPIEHGFTDASDEIARDGFRTRFHQLPGSAA